MKKVLVILILLASLLAAESKCYQYRFRLSGRDIKLPIKTTEFWSRQVFTRASGGEWGSINATFSTDSVRIDGWYMDGWECVVFLCPPEEY